MTQTNRSLRRPHGTVLIQPESGPEQQADTLQCPHCGKHLVATLGQDLPFCLRCTAHTCGSPACRECIPQEVYLESVEAWHTRRLLDYQGVTGGTIAISCSSVPISLEIEALGDGIGRSVALELSLPGTPRTPICDTIITSERLVHVDDLPTATGNLELRYLCDVPLRFRGCVTLTNGARLEWDVENRAAKAN